MALLCRMLKIMGDFTRWDGLELCLMKLILLKILRAKFLLLQLPLLLIVVGVLPVLQYRYIYAFASSSRCLIFNNFYVLFICMWKHLAPLMPNSLKSLIIYIYKFRCLAHNISNYSIHNHDIIIRVIIMTNINLLWLCDSIKRFAWVKINRGTKSFRKL